MACMGGTEHSLCKSADGTQLERVADLYPVSFRMPNVVNKEVTLLYTRHDSFREDFFFFSDSVSNLS